MDEIEKKRVGYARKKARVILEKYFKENPPIKIPIPIIEIAKYYGFEIYELDNLDKDHRALLIDLKEENRKLIGFNKLYHSHNQRFSIGHELGHYFLEHPKEEECTEEENNIYNQEAEEFSAELLMPLDLIKEIMKEYLGNIKGFANALNVSEQALWIRIQKLKLTNKFLDI